MDPRTPELHASGFRALLEVAESSLGRAALEEVLESFGITSAEVQDPNGWFSLEFAEALMQALVERTGDPAVLDRAIKLAVSPRYLGIVYPLFRSFGTPAFLYRQSTRLAPRINKVTDWTVEECGPQRAVISVRRRAGAPAERTAWFCHVRKLQLSELTKLFDLPPAEVEHHQCMLRGNDACIYDVRWKEHRRRFWSWIGLLAGAVVGLSMAGLVGASEWISGFLVLGFALGAWALGRVYELRHDLGNRLGDLNNVYDALTRVTLAHEQRFEQLAEAKREVDLKVEQRTKELSDATRRLSETLAEIQALDRAKTDFFNNVSHELRSPLTLIMAPLEDLVAGRRPPGGEQAAYESMRRNAARLLNLINQLLDLAKIDAGHMEIAPTPTDVVALLESIVTGFEAGAQKKGVRVERRLPASCAPVVLDVSWVESAVNNLVANALRFTNPGGSVRVTLEDRGSDVAISVADDGPGIAEADQEKVFARFAQGDSRRVVGGTGIGLALVREAARLHGGDVRLVSELGKGATFTLTLPRRPDVQASASASERGPAPASARARYVVLDDGSDASPSSDRPGPTPDAPLAIVVEDNPDLREFMADVLAVRYRVRSAGDGREALDLAAQTKPDVIVSDVAMPEMDGYALCRALRKDEGLQGVPVLLVTARTEVASVLEGFEAGANDYVLKPFHGRELLARVDVHVRLRRMVQELALRERHAMLGVLAASVAHQVRNPLTTLVSGLPAMRNRIRDKIDPMTRELIDTMIDCAGRIERLTLDLMDLSRVDRGAGGDYRPCDGLRASVRMLRARVPTGVTVEERVEDCAAITGRPGDMNHVFLNLLDNAARAVGDSGRIRIEAHLEHGAYVVRVGDSGAGIDADAIARIFEPFFTTRPAGEGTGLGLAIAQQVVQQAGGQIEVGRSQLGGAEFVVRIPMSSRRPQSVSQHVH